MKMVSSENEEKVVKPPKIPTATKSRASACQAGVPSPSHVLLAMGVGEDDARGALRFTLGHTSSRHDVDALIEALPAVARRAMAAGLTGYAVAGSR